MLAPSRHPRAQSQYNNTVRDLLLCQHRPGERPYGHPAVVLAVIAFLWIDLLTVSPERGDYSRLGDAILFYVPDNPFIARPRATYRWPMRFPMAQDQSGPIAAWNPEQRTSATTWLGDVYLFEGAREGLYHMTERQNLVAISEYNNALAPRLRAQMFQVFVAEMDRYDADNGTDFRAEYPWVYECIDKATPADLAAARVILKDRHPLPLGYLRNTLTITALLFLAIAITTGGTHRTIRRWIRTLTRRTQPGRCDNCGNQVGRARAHSTCPECAHAAPAPST